MLRMADQGATKPLLQQAYKAFSSRNLDQLRIVEQAMKKEEKENRIVYRKQTMPGATGEDAPTHPLATKF